MRVEDLRKAALGILDAAVRAVDPGEAIRRYLTQDGGRLRIGREVVDLAEVGKVVVRCLRSTDVGIYLPARVEVDLSLDGKDFGPPVAVENGGPPGPPGPAVRSIEARPGRRPARYVRVRAVNVGSIPAGQPGAGTPAWLFVDEVLVDP